MKKIFTLITMALMTLGASAQMQTVLDENYAKKATDGLSYGTTVSVVRITEGSTVKINSQTVSPFKYGDIISPSDVLTNRDVYFRYNNVTNIGLYHANETQYGIQNLKAGDVVEVATNAVAPAKLVNATLATETGTYVHNFTYNVARTLTYTLYTLTVGVDGVAGFSLTGAYVGRITVKRTPISSGSLVCASTTANATIPTDGTDCKSISYGSSETATLTVTAVDDAFRAAKVSSANMDARGINVDGTIYDPIYFLSVNGTTSHKFNITKSANVKKVTMFARKNDGDATKTVTIRENDADGDVIVVANGFGGDLVSADVTSVSTLYVPSGTYIVFKVDYSSTDGIQTVQGDRIADDNAMYNLRGQKVDASYKGVVIKNGKKYLIK